MTSTTQTKVSSPPTPPTDLRELIPALHLLRASGLAIDPRKMFLGGLALVLLAFGDWLFAFLPFAQNVGSIHVTIGSETSAVTRLLGCAGFVTRPHLDAWLSWDAAAFALLTPIRTLIEPARVIFSVAPSWSGLAFAWTQLLWAFIVWSFIGGALCRMNALQFATRKRLNVGAALKFSRRQLLSYLIAPLLPLSAVLILQGFNWLLGCLAQFFPPVGFVALGIGWVAVLFSGFLMAMLILGVAVGWPLMIAAISTEDSDGFDGLSRAFGYLVDRPWKAGLCVVSCFPVFAVSRILVGVLIGLTISLGATAVERGKTFANSSYGSLIDLSSGDRMVLRSISVTDWLDTALTRDRSFSSVEGLAESIRDGWTLIPALLFVGFGPSFFWSATTVSYFLLRQSDDGTPLDAVVDWPEKVEPETPAESEEKPSTETSPDGET
ncbi:MAG: hypothetical protein ACKVII_26525 [Planctomycetales bacterium]|jgi:hypothetical protein